MTVTRIRGLEQIQDATITRAKLVADFLVGSNLNLTDGNNNATLAGLAAGVANNDAVNKGQLDAAIAALTTGTMDPVKTVATGNETLSGTSQTINGYVVAVGDRIATFNQTTFAQDGIYVAAAGAWARSFDTLAGQEIAGKIFTIEEGSAAEEIWLVTNDTGNGIIGTDDITVVKATDITVPATQVFNEDVPVTNGSPTVTLGNTPVVNTERVYLNGLRMNEGATEDYTISGATITFAFNLRTTPPTQADTVVADYEF